MKTPIVSIIVTTKNNQDTLTACLNSIVDQDYPKCELIVVDNKSNDRTKLIARLYTQQVYTKGPERSAQRNFAVKKASGDYILIVDSDMELPPNCVTECVAAMTKSAQAAIIPEESFGDGFWAHCKALERSFYRNNDAIEAPRFFAKSVYLQAGGYDESMAGGEDWDLGNRTRAITDIVRTESRIRHNEGHPTLRSIVGKRRYYAKGFKQYYAKNDTQKFSYQTFKQVADVYWLFLSHPRKLFSNPLHGLGLLLMKTLEFGALAL